MAILANLRNTTTDVIEETMTLDQINLRYYFYCRERHREAELLAMVVAKRVLGG